MISKKYIDEKIELYTITPIFIGDEEGSDLSPITDFVVERDKILIIDQKKFENHLSKDNTLIDEFVEELKNNSRNFNLRSFIENKLNADLNQITKCKIDLEGYLGQSNIKKFISTLGKPFIPGSTVKGAIRTAVIYNYFINSEKGKNIVDGILKDTLLKFQNFEKLEKIKKERKLNKSEFEEYKSIQNFKKHFNELYLFNITEVKYENNNRKEIKYGHDFRHLKFSDSNLLNHGVTKISELRVEYLNKKESKTSAWKQILIENTAAEFNLNIEKNFKDKFLQPLNNSTYFGIFKLLNRFSKDFIEFELAIYNDFIKNSKEKNAIENKLKDITNFYNDLIKKIEFSKDNFAIIRIGGGKTYFDNSIGLALYKADKEVFKKFRKILGFWKHSDNSIVNEDSPITRTFYHDKNTDRKLPIGWIVIYMKDQQLKIDEMFNNQVKINQENKSTEQAMNPEELDLSKLNNFGKVTYSKNN
jgi:CRISPR-associated protein Csm5